MMFVVTLSVLMAGRSIWAAYAVPTLPSTNATGGELAKGTRQEGLYIPGIAMTLSNRTLGATFKKSRPAPPTGARTRWHKEEEDVSVRGARECRLDGHLAPRALPRTTPSTWADHFLQQQTLLAGPGAKAYNGMVWPLPGVQTQIISRR